MEDIDIVTGEVPLMTSAMSSSPPVTRTTGMAPAAILPSSLSPEDEELITQLVDARPDQIPSIEQEDGESLTSVFMQVEQLLYVTTFTNDGHSCESKLFFHSVCV